MAIFHLFEKEDIISHLNIDSPSFLSEKDQLLAQGFERIDQVVHADNSQVAYEKFKQMQLDEVNTSTTSLGASSSGGAGNLLRFISKVNEKGDAKK